MGTPPTPAVSGPPDAAAPAGPPSPPPRRRRVRRVLLLTALALVLGPALVLGAYTWLALNWAYAEGERAGYVQKFSRKGWVCKTWEGELAMVALPGALPEVFRFTVRDEAVARRINDSLGRRVTLRYAQHRGVPTDCFGETEYYVVGLRALEP